MCKVWKGGGIALFLQDSLLTQYKHAMHETLHLGYNCTGRTGPLAHNVQSSRNCHTHTHTRTCRSLGGLSITFASAGSYASEMAGPCSVTRSMDKMSRPPRPVYIVTHTQTHTRSTSAQHRALNRTGGNVCGYVLFVSMSAGASAMTDPGAVTAPCVCVYVSQMWEEHVCVCV